MNFKRQLLADELTEILGSARDEYARCQEEDWAAQAKAGAEAIDKRNFAFGENRERADRVITSARARAVSAIDRRIKEAERAMTDPPTTEEANFITAIRGRTDLTADEMNAALGRYRSHAAQKAIYTAAKASELVRGGHMTEAERDLHDLRGLMSSVEDTYTSDFGNMTRGQTAITANGYKVYAEGGDCNDAISSIFGQ